jgi:hypothetical protein
MSSIIDTIFGGSDTTQQQLQQAENVRARGDIASRAGQARQDVLSLLPVSDINRNLGFQAALDVLGQSQPQQLSTLQQGNIGAQQALLEGLPQIQQAILGGNVDFGALQPRSVSFDPSFLQQQLPQFAGSTVTGGRLNTANNAILSQILSGGGVNFSPTQLAQRQALTEFGRQDGGAVAQSPIERNLANQFGLTPEAIDTSLQLAGMLGVPVVNIGRAFSNLNTVEAARKHANLPAPGLFESLISSESFREQAERAVQEAEQANIERERFAREQARSTRQAQERSQAKSISDAQAKSISDAQARAEADARAEASGTGRPSTSRGRTGLR